MLFCFSSYSYTSSKIYFLTFAAELSEFRMQSRLKSIYYGFFVFRQEKNVLLYYDRKTHLFSSSLPSLAVHSHLLFSGNSSGSVSSQVLPSRFPSDIIKACSTLQLRDSAGFAPAYLLSLSTPDSLNLLSSFCNICYISFEIIT